MTHPDPILAAKMEAFDAVRRMLRTFRDQHPLLRPVVDEIRERVGALQHEALVTWTPPEQVRQEPHDGG